MGSIPGFGAAPGPSGSGGGGGGSQALGGGASAAAKTVSGMKTLRQELQKEVKKQSAFVRLTEKKGLSEGLASQILGGKQPLKTAAKIVQGTKKAATKLQNIFNRTAAGQNEMAAAQQAAAAQAEAASQAAQRAAQEFAREQEELARQEQERLREEQAALAEKERIYKAFADSVSRTFSEIKDNILGAFTLPQLGGSTNAIIRNMDKLLARVKGFSANITKLSDMGLDPKLLQQVINAGPIAGAKLAANLVSGGVAGLSAINRGFLELGGLATDIGTTGTQAAFRGEAQQTIYNLTVNGGLDSGASIGKAVVDAIKAYERTSGVVFQGA
jgi:Fe2+ transport system protein B